MKIRFATIDDLDSIVSIYNQAIRSRQTGDIAELTKDDRIDWFREHNTADFPVFVAEADGLIYGWLSLSKYRPGREAFAHVAEISYYVDQEFTGQGIGKNLMNYCLHYLRDKNIKILIAIILGSNTNSIEFTARCGFSQWAVLPGMARIDGKSIDHVYMGKNLG